MAEAVRIVDVRMPAIAPATRRALAEATPDQSSPEFRALTLQVLDGLKRRAGTAASDAVVLAATGTGAMEAAVSNVLSPGDRVLVLAAGADGVRWATLAKNFGAAVDEIHVPPGESFALDAVHAGLKLETRAVFLQQVESSTGVVHDLHAIAGLLQEEESEALLVVDAMTGLAVREPSPIAIEVDGWGIDVVVGASESVGCPAGASFLLVSPRAWDRMEATYNPRFYFDLRRHHRAQLRGEWAETAPIAHLAALAAALDAFQQS